MSTIRITLELKNTGWRDFQERMLSNDGEFDFIDSLVYEMNYHTPGEPDGSHNGIAIKYECIEEENE